MGEARSGSRVLSVPVGTNGVLVFDRAAPHELVSLREAAVLDNADRQAETMRDNADSVARAVKSVERKIDEGGPSHLALELAGLLARLSYRGAPQGFCTACRALRGERHAVTCETVALLRSPGLGAALELLDPSPSTARSC